MEQKFLLQETKVSSAWNKSFTTWKLLPLAISDNLSVRNAILYIGIVFVNKHHVSNYGYKAETISIILKYISYYGKTRKHRCYK